MRKAEIAQVWESLVRAELPQLDQLDRAALVDHLPEFLEGLASWVEGDLTSARPAFSALAEGHALQRLGHGIDLVTLTREYIVLRSTILRELLAVPSGEANRELMVRVDEGLDEAIHEAVRRYTQRRDQLRDRFVGILAHDLRTPLQGITMAAARLLGDTTGPEDRARRLASMITRSAERMGRMIHDLIDLARGQLGGGMHIVLREGDLGELCREALDEVRLAHPDRELVLERSGDLRGMWDHDRVIQAMSNLIGNAVEHGGDPITLSIRETPDREAIITAVNDRGGPIPATRLARLFDPIREETAPRRKGLGLGLYVARQIATAHGARIRATSTKEAGTTFEVEWPRTPAAEGPARV